MSMKQGMIVCVVALLLLGAAVATEAQTTTGRLIGSIQDDGGVALGDYSLLKANFYTIGDPE